jgi:uncharacterized membrane protein HdeD (DUF308 family)
MSQRIFFTLSGIVLLIGGICALFLPVAASLAATLYVGVAFAVAGVLHLIHGARTRDDRWWNISFGALGILLGASFVANPFGGMLSLTVLLGGLFMGSGIMQLYLAFKRRSTDRVLFLALSGVVSVALALMIAFNLFTATVTLPGIVLGVELITTGFAFLTLRGKASQAGSRGTDSEGQNPADGATNTS